MYFRKIITCVVPTLTLFLVLLNVTGCTTNPYTNRSQFLLIPESQEVQMGNRAYAQALNDPKVVISKNPAEVEPVQRVAERIIAAAKRSKYAKRAESFEWEVSVIKADGTKNAWALPGGKIAFYTGIFPEAKNENGLAAIMGHEVVHALARHGAERVSQHTAADLGMRIAGAALNMKPLTQTLAMQALGIGVLLPFSRGHESEADYIGLLLAADAGYDPREAVLAYGNAWLNLRRVLLRSFLSTHPCTRHAYSRTFRNGCPKPWPVMSTPRKLQSLTLPSIE